MPPAHVREKRELAPNSVFWTGEGPAPVAPRAPLALSTQFLRQRDEEFSPDQAILIENLVFPLFKPQRNPPDEPAFDLLGEPDTGGAAHRRLSGFLPRAV